MTSRLTRTIPDETPVTPEELEEICRLVEHIRARLYVAANQCRASIGAKRGARATVTMAVSKIIEFSQELKQWL
mgnify:CR=1 FL=1